MSIAYIHFFNNPIKKILYYAINITMTKAKLFAIRCGINQTIQVTNSSYIIIITNAIHSAQYIFDSSIHSYQ